MDNPTMYVIVNGEKYYNTDPSLKIVDIKEDIQGRDVLTFTIDDDPTLYESYIFKC